MTAPRRSGLIALVLATVVLVVQAPVLLGGRTWDDVPYHTAVAPPRLAAADAVWHGELPAWWDGTGLGVPLLGEPSHGAAYPPVWLAATPRVLDLLWIVHVLWCALGVALWARRLRASELGALGAGALVATTGVIASAAIRGALPALAHLPWVGLATDLIAQANTRRERARGAIALAVLLGLIGLGGQLVVLAQAIALAVFAAVKPNDEAAGPGELNRRDAKTAKVSRKGGDGSGSNPSLVWSWRLGGWIFFAVAVGALISAVQWLPALFVDDVGASLHRIAVSRLVEIVVPGSFGSSDPELAVASIAGASAWFPTLYVGVPMLALAAIGAPARRFIVAMAVLLVLAFVVAHGELFVAALALIAAAHAGRGIDALLAGERRAIVALAGGTAVLALALGGLGVLRAREHAPALDRALIEGSLGLACLAVALVVGWRARRGMVRSLFTLALVIAPNVGAQGSLAPTTDRAIVDDMPAWVRRAQPVGPAPLRVYRPPVLFEGPRAQPEPLATAIATLAGTSAARWGLATAQSTDPARPRADDRVWLAAAAMGGQLFARYGVELAILPNLATGRRGGELATRGSWSLVRAPASPPAAVVSEWIWIADDEVALARLFPPGTSRGLDAGLVVLHGHGTDNQDEPSRPEACAIEAWRPGAIDLVCDARSPTYAVISSSAARGWSVSVDGHATAWQTADVIRRAVAIAPGNHRIEWRYAAPGLALGLALLALAFAALGALWLVVRRA